MEIVRFTTWTDSLAALYMGKADIVQSTYFNTLSYNGKGEAASIILLSNTIVGVEGLVVKKDLSDLKTLKGKKNSCRKLVQSSIFCFINLLNK